MHYVNEKLDAGRIISQKSFYILPDFNEKDVKDRTQKLEYLAYPEAILKIFRISS